MAAAGLISIALAAAIVGVLVAGLAQLRGRTLALLAGLLLVGTPFFLAFAPNQHADIPLAGCMLPPWRSPCWANVGRWRVWRGLAA